MSALKMSGTAVTLAMAGLLSVPLAATAIDRQESASIQSQCRREAQEYGIDPEQIEEYVRGCVLAYGGMPATTLEADAPPDEAGADAPADGAEETDDAGVQDTEVTVE